MRFNVATCIATLCSSRRHRAYARPKSKRPGPPTNSPCSAPHRRTPLLPRHLGLCLHRHAPQRAPRTQVERPRPEGRDVVDQPGAGRHRLPGPRDARHHPPDRSQPRQDQERPTPHRPRPHHRRRAQTSTTARGGAKSDDHTQLADLDLVSRRHRPARLSLRCARTASLDWRTRSGSATLSMKWISHRTGFPATCSHLSTRARAPPRRGSRAMSCRRSRCCSGWPTR